MDLVQQPSAKAVWPHEKMTSDNAVDIGISWFDQMSSIMGNYLSGSSRHVFGEECDDHPWGPYHLSFVGFSSHFASVVSTATSRPAVAFCPW